MFRRDFELAGNMMFTQVAKKRFSARFVLLKVIVADTGSDEYLFYTRNTPQGPEQFAVLCMICL